MATLVAEKNIGKLRAGAVHHADVSDGRVQLSLLFFFCLIMGFISAQRFFLSDVSAVVCIVILAIPLTFGFHRKEYFTILFLSIVSIVDLGGEVYTETPSILKYFIYLSLILFSSYVCIYKIEKLHKYLILFLSFVVINTFLHPDRLDGYTFARDIITIYLILLVAFSSKIKDFHYLNNQYILAFSVGIVVSEIINILSNYTVVSGDYLNYSSFKFLAFFPVIYFICYKRYFLAAIFTPLSFAVVGVYASRMLLLTGILICLILLLSGLRYYFWRTLFLTILSLSIILVSFNAFDINFEAYRIFSVFYALGDFQDFATAALFLDPVRYAENSVFFGQNIFLLLFGNGLGTGMLDVTGVFAFIPDDGAAFSPQELSESHYFRLHDSWTWIGFRFGFLAYLIFVFWGVKGCLNKNAETALFASLMLLALFNATFSIGGLIACAVLALHYKLAMNDALKII